MRLNWTAHTLAVRGEATPHLCRHKDAPQWPARPNDDNPMRELKKKIDTIRIRSLHCKAKFTLTGVPTKHRRKDENLICNRQNILKKNATYAGYT